MKSSRKRETETEFKISVEGNNLKKSNFSAACTLVWWKIWTPYYEKCFGQGSLSKTQSFEKNGKNSSSLEFLIDDKWLLFDVLEKKLPELKAALFTIELLYLLTVLLI